MPALTSPWQPARRAPIAPSNDKFVVSRKLTEAQAHAAVERGLLVVQSKQPRRRRCLDAGQRLQDRDQGKARIATADLIGTDVKCAARQAECLLGVHAEAHL